LGIGGRENDIDFVRRLADDAGNSTVRLRNSLNINARFDFGNNLAGDLVPDNWQFVLNQDTSRNLLSFLQTRNWSLTTTKNIPLRKLRFWVFDETTAPGKSVQDLNLRFSYGEKYDYNRKTIENTFGGALGFSIRWNRDTAFGLSYQLERSGSRQSLFAGDPGYVYMGLGNDTGSGQGDSFGDIEELPDGSPPGYTELPPFSRYQHQIRLDHSFPTAHSDTLNLFGLKIPLDTHWRHKSELVLRFADSAYERARSGRYEFTELFDRTFFASLRHSIDYDFSQSWNGIFYLLAIFEHWRLLRPAGDGGTLIDEGFGLSFGMEIGLKMLLRF
jgi:hypothetical protein